MCVAIFLGVREKLRVHELVIVIKSNLLEFLIESHGNVIPFINVIDAVTVQ